MRFRHLEDVPAEHNFRLRNGNEIKNLHELAFHLAEMDDNTFCHHVNGEKNDFRNWILDIVKDKKLAGRIAGAKDRKSIAKAVEKRVNQLESEKSHRRKVLEQGIRWGVKEFGIGLVTGLFIGLVVLRALGQI